MTSRSTSAIRKQTSTKSAAKSRTVAKAVTKKTAKTDNKSGKLPEWNLGDLYAGIDAPEVVRDLATMDRECVAFETNYKGRLAEHTAHEDGGKWLPGGARRDGRGGGVAGMGG